MSFQVSFLSLTLGIMRYSFIIVVSYGVWVLWHFHSFLLLIFPILSKLHIVEHSGFWMLCNSLMSIYCLVMVSQYVWECLMGLSCPVMSFTMARDSNTETLYWLEWWYFLLKPCIQILWQCESMFIWNLHVICLWWLLCFPIWYTPWCGKGETCLSCWLSLRAVCLDVN